MRLIKFRSPIEVEHVLFINWLQDKLSTESDYVRIHRVYRHPGLRMTARRWLRRNFYFKRYEVLPWDWQFSSVKSIGLYGESKIFVLFGWQFSYFPRTDKLGRRTGHWPYKPAFDWARKQLKDEDDALDA